MNENVLHAYMSMIVESVEIPDLADIEFDETIVEATGDRPSDSELRKAVGTDQSRSNHRFNTRPADLASFKTALTKTHSATVKETKAKVATLGGKVTVKKIRDDHRLQTHIFSDGHPVAEVLHISQAKNEDEYKHWDKGNNFSKHVNHIPKVNVDLHAEHNAELAKHGYKTKKKFDNSNVIITDLEKPSTHHWGHGSQSSVNTKTKSIVSKVSGGSTKHETKDVWDKYD